MYRTLIAATFLVAGCATGPESEAPLNPSEGLNALVVLGDEADALVGTHDPSDDAVMVVDALVDIATDLDVHFEDDHGAVYAPDVLFFVADLEVGDSLFLVDADGAVTGEILVQSAQLTQGMDEADASTLFPLCCPGLRCS